MPRGGGFRHAPQTIGLDFHNVARAEASADLVFDRGDYPGELSVMLTKLPSSPSLRGFDLVDHDGLDDILKSHVGRWLERTGEFVEHLGEELEGQDASDGDDETYARRELHDLDRERIYRADTATAAPTISGVPIPAHGFVTAVVHLRAPEDAKPGDHYRFNILQRARGRIVGGSTYVYTIVAT